MRNMIEVIEFAKYAHSGQVRKYTGEPYIVHCAEVAALTASAKNSTNEMVAAAWLHDVVEDTNYSLWDIEKKFGRQVSDFVYWLTKASKPEDGNRAVRKAIDCAFLASAPAKVQTIKYADLISNTGSIATYDPKFARVYMQEKRKLLAVMNKGDSFLYQRARDIVDIYFGD